MAQPSEILEYWFGKPGDEEYGKPRPAWFGPDPAFDDEARRFLPEYERAARGELREWEKTPEGSLALVLLFDQLPSMLFRGKSKAFATDAEARRIARSAVERGFDQQFPDVHRWFFYLPFEHGENAADQELSVRLFGALEPNDANRYALDYAVRHKRVIDRFGRFPNRNAALGRKSTPEEEEFLAGPDAPF